MIHFAKLSGTGNDFLVFDNRSAKIKDPRKLALEACSRKRSVGADGILLLERSKKANLKMRIINSDGSEAEMCGNGIRCFALYAYINGICGKNAAVETLAGIKNTSVLDKKNGLVNVDMGMPSDIKVIELKLEGRKFTVYFLNTGVPHAVIFSNNPQVKVDGRKIRYHKTFKPAGTNVNFAGVTGRNSINVRTYERGVEDETDACGTGSTAAAYIANKFKNVKFPVSVKTLGGDMLRIDINKEGHLFMAGGVKYICEGILF